MLAVGHMRRETPLGWHSARARCVLARGDAPLVAFRACGIPSGVRWVANGAIGGRINKFFGESKGVGSQKLEMMGLYELICACIGMVVLCLKRCRVLWFSKRVLKR
jgi:hypothetical protein